MGSIKTLRRWGASLMLPKILNTDNKARRGRSLLFAGSEQYPGAGVLAAKAALRMGSGYVTLAQKNPKISSLENPDFLICDLAKKDWKELTFDAVLVGPGFGVNEFTAEIIRGLKEMEFPRVVLDADALTVCAEKKLFPLLPTWIVTPHSGELGRCLGISSSDIESDRISAVQTAQKKLGCVVLLKGHNTLIQSPYEAYRIGSGNAALAKSGTGDVLAGVITSLRTQGLPPVQSALLGAYLHGATANLWHARRKDLLSMMASDVIDLLPEVIYKLRSV